MKAYIWDLDGTLIDSYRGILDSLHKVHISLGIPFIEEDVYHFIIEKSVHEYLEMLAQRSNTNPERLSNLYGEERKKNQMEVTLIPGAKEILAHIVETGGASFIYTHKGNSTFQILDNLGIGQYFTEVVTIERGFALKPKADAVEYLLKKHSLEKENACYIGDRPIDMECARNAQITGVFYCPEGCPLTSSYGDITIKELLDIKNI